MDDKTVSTIREHLAACQEHLAIAKQVPTALSLTILEDAMHQLEAAVDTLRQARMADWFGGRPRRIHISTNPDALVHSQHLNGLINDARASANVPASPLSR